jgi:hypothetical protein
MNLVEACFDKRFADSGLELPKQNIKHLLPGVFSYSLGRVFLENDGR